MSNTASQIELIEKIQIAANTDIERMAPLFHLLAQRQKVAHELVHKGNSMSHKYHENMCAAFEYYNEDIKKVLGL